MKRLLFWTIIFTVISIFPNASYARYSEPGDHGVRGNPPSRGHGYSQRPNYNYYQGHWRGPSYRSYYRPYYRPWYGPGYPRSYYIPGPVYVYPPPPVIYAPLPPAIIVPNQAYAYPDPPPPPPVPQPAPPPQPAPAATLQPIYFDLNKSNIRADAEKTLRQNLEWFRQNPGRKVTIQGNCDPRATEQYNISLGKRRAEAARQYLISLGIDAKLLDVVSFGKEMSTCKGRDEPCWAKERRVDFIPAP